MEPYTRPRRQLAIGREEPMENVSRASRLKSPIESSFELGPEDSISQIVDRPLSRNLTEEAQGISLVLTDDVISSQPTRGTVNHWLWEQFEHCRNLSIDSARSTSTTNMSYQRAHGWGVSNDTKNTNLPAIMTIIVREESYSLGRAYQTAIYCH
ncbi:hypothetical protein V1520DRAFT_393872 [Lipomyces starkeyi]